MKSVMLFALGVALSGCATLQGMVAIDGTKTVAPHSVATPASNPSGKPLFSATPIVTQPVLEVTILDRGAQARLNKVGQNGTVTTWASKDGISVSLDRGVLVATRGLGDDLMAAGAQATLDALTGKPGEYRRIYRFLDAQNHADYELMGCTMQTLGPETLAARRLIRHEETCRTFTDSHTNVYWTNPGGRIVASRQWISPLVGSLTASES
jgi:hypothetical protein